MGKKGITNFEFVLAVFVFLSTISFVSLSIINKIPNIHAVSVGEDVKSSSYYMSQVLIFDRGSPSDWEALVGVDESRINRTGLAGAQSYVLDSTKVAKLGELCVSSRNKIREMFGNFVLDIKKLNGDSVLSCSTTAPIIELVVRRNAVYQGEPVVVEVISG